MQRTVKKIEDEEPTPHALILDEEKEGSLVGDFVGRTKITPSACLWVSSDVDMPAVS